MLKEKVVELLGKRGSMTPKEVMQALRVTTTAAQKELNIALNELEDERQIYNDHEKYVLVDNVHYMVGKARDISSSEYAVMNPEMKVYVPKKDSRILMDRDEVLVKLDKRGNEVLHVYQRGITMIPGTFVSTRHGMKFRSDVDLHTSFHITNKSDYNLEPGMKAVVKVIDYAAPLKAKISEVLGREDEPGVDVSAILAENEVRQEFGKKIKKELKDIPDKVRRKDLEDRHDLRDLKTVTIDGDSTKDFDDAVSIEETPNGYKLYVHIADVSYYVPEKEEIDQEAFKRGTSIYVADRVVPMLPFKLSNGICSLNPDVDRLTLTCEIDFTKEGIMTGARVYESVIHSDQRCTYSKVNAFLENPESVPEYKEVGTLLNDLSDLAKKLKEQTQKRGHIEFETKEPHFVLDEKGMPTAVEIRERGWSEQIIEEAMIAANVAVAHTLHSKGLPGMFRVHEVPDPEKLQTLVNMAKALNVKCEIDPENCEPKDIAAFLNTIEDEGDKEILSSVAVRSMQKARYSEQNLGHYGLALEEYCHFTSPIRRYPDLLIHRMLRKYITGDEAKNEKAIAKDFKKMAKVSQHLSDKERDAVTIERAVNDLESAKFMSDKVGKEFDGVITGVASFGFFVELDNTIEGLVPMRTLEDDFYQYDADTMTLTGENSGKSFRLGQKVHVRLKDVNVPKRQITFELKEAALPEAAKEELPAETVSVQEPVEVSCDALTVQPAEELAVLPVEEPAVLPAEEPAVVVELPVDQKVSV